MSEKKKNFIGMMAPHVREVAARTGLDPRLILAQSAVETGWGGKAPGHNYFGIKSHNREGGQNFMTTEYIRGAPVKKVQNFREYSGPEESSRDYASFILENPRYQEAMKAKGIDDQIKAIGKSGYATDPRYGRKLRAVALGIELPPEPQPEDKPVVQEQRPVEQKEQAPPTEQPQPPEQEAEAVNYNQTDPRDEPVAFADGGEVNNSILHDNPRRAENLAAFLAGNHPDVPHVVYHGSNKDINNFDTKLGAWFSEKPSLANEYASKDDGSVYPVHLSIKNPINFLHAEQRKSVGEIISHALNGVGNLEPEQIEKAKSLIGELRQTHGDEPKELFEFWRNDPNVPELFRTLGYDGISAFERADRKTKTWAALNPEQIKSATGNIGNFDATEQDINKADGGAVDDEYEGLTAYHGSPHDFEQFDTSKIGTGEGAQSYGHGLYFAESEPVAKQYRENLTAGTYKGDTGQVFDPFSDLEHLNVRVAAYKSIDNAIDRAKGLLEDYPNSDAIKRDLAKLMEAKAQNATPRTGHMYEVKINAHPDHFLDWDTPLNEQSEHVQSAIKSIANSVDVDQFDHLALAASIGKHPRSQDYSPRGNDLYADLEEIVGDRTKLSDLLHQHGLKGIRYLDAGSRFSGKGSRNYVVFNHDHVQVKRKYAQGGAIDET